MESDQIEKVIEQIRFLPNAQVDCGIEQGQNQFFAQLSKHVTTPELLELPFELYVMETNKSLARIEKIISPHSLPADYLSFLNRYGGITISSNDSYFASLGFGPMAEEWYPYLMGKAGHYENGFLKIGTLRIRNFIENNFMYVSFFLDIGSRIQQHCVIQVSMWKLGNLNLQDVFRELQSCSFCWSIVANSFTEWLQVAAITKGRFEHLQT
jgi:hypothetical protein